MLKHKRAQSFNEYAMIIALVTLVGLGMQNYIKQGVQSVVKMTADNLANGGMLDKSSVPVIAPDGMILAADMHKAAKDYKDKVGGFVYGEKKGNDIYYYHFTTDPDDKTAIGVENALTHDFTGFDMDGLPNGVVDASNVAYKDLKFTRIEDPLSVEVQRKVDGVYVGVGTYTKFAAVSGTTVPPEEALALQNGVKEPGLYNLTMVKPIKVQIDKSTTVKTTTKREKTINKDITKVTGEWNATYNLNSGESFSSLDKKKTVTPSGNSQQPDTSVKK